MSVASAVAIGPWAPVLMLGAALWVVGSVLARCLRSGNARAVTVRVRILGLLRVEVELGTNTEPVETLPALEDSA